MDTLLALASDEARESGGLGVTQIADMLGREKSQVSRALKVLAEYGLVERNRDSLTYRMGWRVFTLAQLASKPRILEEGAPILRGLVDSLEERVHLSVLQGSQVLTIMSESPSRAIEAAGWVGRITPSYSSSAGMALLMDYSPEDLDRLFKGVEFERFAPHTVSNVSELVDRVGRARDAGVAIVDEEFEAGLVAAAAPVRDVSGQIAAAINVSAPKFRFGDSLEDAAVQVKKAADELTLVLAGEPGTSD